MRILIISPFFYPHTGGSQQYAQELYRTLRMVDPSIMVDILCYNTDHRPLRENYEGLTIYRVPCIQILPGQFAVPNYISLFQILRKLKKNKYKFINAHTRFFESSWWAPFVARWFRAQSILTDHCAQSPVHSSPLVSAIARWVDTFLVPKIANRYDIVTVTNKATASFVKSLGIKNPQVVYGGVDTKYFKSIDSPFQGNDTVVTFVGRMIPSKGPKLLLDVAKEITKKYKNVQFFFAGDGELFKNLSSKKIDRITFLGKQDKNEVAKLLQKTDILVHPSLHHEGFPNVILEAGAAGCAVVATDRGGTREIVIDEKTGLIVTPTQKDIMTKITDLIEDETKRKYLGSSLRNHVTSNFDWQKIAKDFHKNILCES